LLVTVGKKHSKNLSNPFSPHKSVPGWQLKFPALVQFHLWIAQAKAEKLQLQTGFAAVCPAFAESP